MVVSDGVSVVATVLNERPLLALWLDGIESQTRRPDELVIVDGGSTDGTWEELNERQWSVPVVLLRLPGASISAGRNAAIDAATHDVIAVTDAGTVAHPEWLNRLITTLVLTGADVASGFFVPRTSGNWQRALAATTLPDAAEINAHRFQPSSRSMVLRRSWWLAGVRYPEWLDYCEDLVWDMAMRRAGARFVFVPEATVTFDVRESLSAYVRQYFRYARGDGKAGLFPLRHVIRYSAYLFGTSLLARRTLRARFAVGVLGLLYVRAPLRRLRVRDMAMELTPFESVRLVPLVIGLRAVGDVAKMCGYPVGVAWRLRHFPALYSWSAWERISWNGSVAGSRSTTGNPAPTSSPSCESRLESP